MCHKQNRTTIKIELRTRLSKCGLLTIGKDATQSQKQHGETIRVDLYLMAKSEPIGYPRHPSKDPTLV